MAVTSDGDTRLECGRDIDDIWDGIAHPPTGHEQYCPHCRDARASLVPLARLTTDQRSADDVDPDLRPAPEVLARVMDIARAEVRRARRLPLDDLDSPAAIPTLTVSEQTVAAVARRAADAVAGVQVRRCQVAPAQREPSPEAGPASEEDTELVAPHPDWGQSWPAAIRVTLQVSVSILWPIPIAAERVQRAVQAAIEADVGLDAIRVDVDVRDIHDA